MVFPLALALFLLAGSASVRRLNRQLRVWTLPYWVLAWTGQTFALPLALWSGLSALWLLPAWRLFPLSALLLTAAALLFARQHWQSWQTGRALFRRVAAGVAGTDAGPAAPDPTPPWYCGLLPALLPHTGLRILRHVPYGAAGRRQQLDIYLPLRPPHEPMPILINIHGGAWITGSKEYLGIPLLQHLARRGWMGVSINYRLGPRHRLPTMIADVLQAMAWIRERAADYGGDPDFVALTGGSAGGHLAALAALVANEVAEGPDAAADAPPIKAAVPLYGRFDFLDRHGVWGQGAAREELIRFHADHVLPGIPDSVTDSMPEAWREGSPIDRVHTAAPPFLLLHGTYDTLIDPEETRHFAEALAAVSPHGVTAITIPGAQHAFEALMTPLTHYTVHAIALFLEAQRRTGKARDGHVDAPALRA